MGITVDGGFVPQDNVHQCCSVEVGDFQLYYGVITYYLVE